MGTANQAVIDAFEGLTADLVATLGPIAVGAITIAGIFLAFKYGRKILNIVAK